MYSTYLLYTMENQSDGTHYPSYPSSPLLSPPLSLFLPSVLPVLPFRLPLLE